MTRRRSACMIRVLESRRRVAYGVVNESQSGSRVGNHLVPALEWASASEGRTGRGRIHVPRATVEVGTTTMATTD